MVNPKNLLPISISFLILAVFALFSQPVFASQSKYFDYGPYYSAPSVLGWSLSSLENLPSPDVPDNLMPAPAKGILPGNPFYGLERTWENTQLAFTFNPIQKEQLRLKMAEERLSEAKTLMDRNQIQTASQALDDYGKTVGDIAENLSVIAQTNTPQAQDLINQVEQATAAQAVVATALSTAAPPAQAENWTDAASAARDILDKVAESRNEPAIPESLSTGLQQLKEQGLISEEESNKIYSLKNRSEVREELVKLNSAGGLPPSEIAKLDEGVAKFYPDIQNQQIANWQIVELRSYQALPQPTEEQIEELKKWENNQNTPPSNDIKQYLWYNRARDLAKEVDLSNFSQTQQSDLVKYYPEAQTNPTYAPPPSPSPTPAPSPTPTATADPTATPSPSATAEPSPSPSATPVPADPYLQDAGTLPGQPTYIINQLGEGFSLALTFDPAEKARLKLEQAERRLAEAAKLSTDPKKAGLYESTLKTYRKTLADASNRVKNLPEGRKSRKVAEKLEAQAARHEVIFEKGLLPSPPKDPKLLSEVIKTTEDALDRSADVLDRPALPPALTSRLGDLKAQGLILEEEAEDLVRSNSREEVREKIRELVAQKGFPLADAKKMDEAQSRVSPADYNQLVEVRKVEELQNLRAVQTELAQTPTLKSQVSTLGQKEANLTNSFDPALIKKEDLGNRSELVKVYEKLASIPRPINGGQFGAEATPGATPAPAPEDEGSRRGGPDAGSGICPEGAVLDPSRGGCIWADGRIIDDYNQYQCDQPRQYYSFKAKKCISYKGSVLGFKEDAQPVCPVGYLWSWYTNSCEPQSRNILPSPLPEPEPEDGEETERQNTERSKYCPQGASYKIPRGCVWDDTDKELYDSNQYRCSSNQYYSFDARKCVDVPAKGEPYPEDTTPVCREEGAFWSWTDGKCIPIQTPTEEEQKVWASGISAADPPKPWIVPGSPFYIFKQTAERIQYLAAFTPAAKEQVALSQAKERLTEAIEASKKNDEAGIKNALTAYTTTMQNLVGDLSKAQLSQNAKEQIGKNLSEAAVQQNLLLQKVQALAPATQDSAISAAVSASILGVDKAADIAGEPSIPDEVKSKIESLPEEMISEEDKKVLLETDSRVDARLKLGGLIANGALTQTEAGFLNEDFDKVNQNARIKVEELKKLEQIADATENKEKLVEKVEKNENIAQKLAEFEKTFEAGNDVPAEIRPYVRLTRINEVAQTVRPDIIRLEDFQNRKDVLLAVATLQEEFKPTKESWAKVADFRRSNPGTPLPPELARIEALSFSLGVRNQAGPCYLPTPPFAPNTPCPAPGAAVPINSYTGPASRFTELYQPLPAPSTDKDGKPLVYGQGPKPEKSGVCSSGYHWMYDSGGWCMSNTGSYSSSYNYTPTGPQTAGYTPYSPYYNAPGAPPATYGYPTGGNYPGSPYSYSAPSYYGPASTYYTTNPPAGTVPGSGPRPTAPGQCPSGFHWMSDSGGWCMADGPTYVPGGPPPSPYQTGTVTSSTPPAGGYNCGSQPYDPVTKKCKDGACPGGFNWDGSKCVAGGYSGGSYSGGIYSGSSYPSCPSGYSWGTSGCQPSSSTYSSGGSNYYSPSSYEYGCTPGSFWNGSKCQKGDYEGPGWSDSAAQSGTYCQPPSGGCGSGWFDYGSCSCKQASSQGCYNVSASSCGSGWYFDSAACTCRQSTSSGTSGGSTGTSTGSCPSGSHWMSENGGYCMSDSAPSGSSSGGSTSSGGGSSISCPSGYHVMDNSWCMSDAERDSGSSGGSGSTSTSTTSQPSTTESAPTTTAPASEPAPTSSEPAPAPPSEPAPAPSSPSP